ncbi:hypothetical protein [Nocardioides xinjiangensis]|uniref:hypothetical protein n=1 Tax=Nocardioides xinjiangensis TaxID=2817376 RepID=UPI001B315FD6|nr:hypothetical protein [Nocardioides sp. SYSU D00778]
MLSTLLASAVVTAGGVLPVPLPPLPTDPVPPPTAEVQQVEVSGTLSAADGRLRRGCKDYRYAYAVVSESEDWTFDITLQDRFDRGVNSQSLLGPYDDEAGVLTYRLCRRATSPGRFTLTGRLTAYEGTSKETSVTVTESFRLRRRNR